VTELVGDFRQRLFRKVMGPGRDVHHTVPGLDDDLVGQIGAIGASERGGLDAGLGERRPQLADVHVHATAVAGTRLQQRRRVE